MFISNSDHLKAEVLADPCKRIAEREKKQHVAVAQSPDLNLIKNL